MCQDSVAIILNKENVLSHKTMSFELILTTAGTGFFFGMTMIQNYLWIARNKNKKKNKKADTYCDIVFVLLDGWWKGSNSLWQGKSKQGENEYTYNVCAWLLFCFVLHCCMFAFLQFVCSTCCEEKKKREKRN